MLNHIKWILFCLYNAFIKMIDHDGVEHAGYMSFMLLFSLFPFFVFILAFTSFFGASELGENFINIALEYMPAQSIDAIRSALKNLIEHPPQELLNLAILGSIWTSSSFVECLRTILNRVYEIKPPFNYIFRRLMSIAQFLMISIMISLAMLLLVIAPIGLAKLPKIIETIGHYQEILNFARYILIFLSLFLTVSLLYYIIPNSKIRLKEVIPGAVVSVVLWFISGYLLTKYIGYYHQLNIVYGSIGSIIITLLFFYIVNMIFIYGAEFNYLIHKKNEA